MQALEHILGVLCCAGSQPQGDLIVLHRPTMIAGMLQVIALEDVCSNILRFHLQQTVDRREGSFVVALVGTCESETQPGRRVRFRKSNDLFEKFPCLEGVTALQCADRLLGYFLPVDG